MGPMAVVMVDELSEHGLKMTTTDNQHPIQTLPTDGTNESFGEGVGSWRLDRSAHDRAAFATEHLEAGRELFGLSARFRGSLTCP